MAPEQAMGEEADARSDQYAMGCLLYHLLTGRAPFAKGKILVVLKAVQAGDFAKPRQVRGEIPQSLEDIVLRAMSLDPAARFPSVYVLGRSVLPVRIAPGARAVEGLLRSGGRRHEEWRLGAAQGRHGIGANDQEGAQRGTVRPYHERAADPDGVR